VPCAFSEQREEIFARLEIKYFCRIGTQIPIRQKTDMPKYRYICFFMVLFFVGFYIFSSYWKKVLALISKIW